jgi:hypothetical protein
MKKLLFLLVIGLLIFKSGFSQVDIGEKHNKVLSFMDNYDFTAKTPEVFFKDVYTYTESLFGRNNIGSNSLGDWGIVNICGNADPKGLDLTKVGTIDRALIVLEKNGQITPSTKSAFSRTLSEFEGIESYEKFSNKLNEFEKSFNYRGLSTTESNIVYGLISVYRNSASYWNKYFSNTNVTPDGLFKSWKCTWCLVKKDLLGAGLGFAMGACICAKLGADPVTCGAIGAVVIGSIYSWAAKVCPDICSDCKKPNGGYPSWICNLPFLYW